MQLRLPVRLSLQLLSDRLSALVLLAVSMASAITTMPHTSDKPRIVVAGLLLESNDLRASRASASNRIPSCSPATTNTAGTLRVSRFALLSAGSRKSQQASDEIGRTRRRTHSRFAQ